RRGRPPGATGEVAVRDPGGPPVRAERHHRRAPLGAAGRLVAGPRVRPRLAGPQEGPVDLGVLQTNDAEVYRAFLRGLYEATGSVSRGGPVWRATTSELADDVQSLLLALGFVTTRTATSVRLLNKSSNARWLEEIGFVSPGKARAVDTTVRAESGRRPAFFFDYVTSAELGDEELTYDLSVPENVTYLANGFVSHNTIGLMMDCDTT